MSEPQSRRFLIVVPRTDAAGELTVDMLDTLKGSCQVYSKVGQDFHVLLQYSSCRRLSQVMANVKDIIPNASVSCTTVQSESYYNGWQKVMFEDKEDNAALLHITQDISLVTKLKELKRKREELEAEYIVASYDLQAYIVELQSLLP